VGKAMIVTSVLEKYARAGALTAKEDYHNERNFYSKTLNLKKRYQERWFHE
jgi:hypothetical protein